MLRVSIPVPREPRSWTSMGRRVRLAATVIVAISAALLATPTSATAVGPVSGSLTLDSQSTWTAVPGTFSITLDVRSSFAPSDLGVVFTLYSQLPNRFAFAVSTTNTELPAEACLERSSVLPVADVGGATTNGKVPLTIRFKSSTEAPSCSTPTSDFTLDCRPGQCSDVYPLEVALVERGGNHVIRSFTTHVVVASSGAGSNPLSVGVIAPLGASPSLAPDGITTLTKGLGALEAQVHSLAQSRARFSVALYPDLLLGLKRTNGSEATSIVTAIDALVSHARVGARVELLSTPFANVDATALTENGLGSDVQSEIAAGRLALDSHFGHTIPIAPFASSAAMNAAGLAELQGSCLSEFVVPEKSAPALVGSQFTPTAPMLVGKTKSCGPNRAAPIAFVADTTLSAELSSRSSDPVLAGENVLADLAQVYFEGPFDPDPRAVVVMADQSFDPRVMQVVLDGLVGNPIITSVQLSNLFHTVPPGSNDNVATANLSATSSSDAPTSLAISSAKQIVRAIRTTVPNNHPLQSSLNDALFIAESAGLSRSARDAYLSAPSLALRGIDSGISITGSGQFTLTSRSGKVPITIESSVSHGPAEVLVRLHSSQLVLPYPLIIRLTLNAKDTDDTVSIGTRTSGSSDLDVTIFSATGGFELAHRTIVVRSTAVSGVAIALSAAALLVLLAWWLRSIMRGRRRTARADGGDVRA